MNIAETLWSNAGLFFKNLIEIGIILKVQFKRDL